MHVQATNLKMAGDDKLSEGNGLLKSRPLFFVCITVLASSFPSYFIHVKILSVSIALFYLGLEFTKNNLLFKKIILVGLSLLFFSASQNPFIYSFIATAYFKLFFLRPSRFEQFMWSISASLPMTILCVETALFYGLPLGIFFIWWWGAGFLALVIILQLILRGKTFLVVSLLGISLFSIHQLYQATNVGKFNVVTEKVADKGYANSFRAVESSIGLVQEYDPAAYGDKDSLIISLAENPGQKDTKIAESPRSNIYIFAEHGDIENIKPTDSQFNNDNYKRKTPWILHRPMFRKDLELSSNKDPLYCSNIGCTVKKDLFQYPIVWDYTQLGVPVILASGSFLGDKRIVFYGDSDPIVPFLIPYNVQFLRSLFNIFDYRLLLEILPIIISSLILTFNLKSWLIVMSFAAVSFSFFSGNILPSTVNAASEFDIKTNLKIHSPHYDSSFSSLPANLAKDGLSVSINSNSELSIPIYVLNSRYCIGSNHEVPAIFFLLENTEIVFGKTRIRVAKTPLGKSSAAVNEKILFVNDARSLILNGRVLNSPIHIVDGYTVVATQSPQLNVELIENLRDIIQQVPKLRHQ